MTYAITIDGPSGSGKSTIAKALAKELHILYIDTGAMYRATALLLKRNNIDSEDAVAIEKILNEHKISFIDGIIAIDNEIVEQYIRTEEISKLSSIISQHKIVRDYLVSQQREMAFNEPLVMEGRDIGTVVLPNAKYKFFLTANPNIRAKRRYEQIDKSESYEQVLKDIKERDKQDINRKISPLIKAKDAIIIDSTDLSVDEVVEKMKNYIQEYENVL